MCAIFNYERAAMENKPIYKIIYTLAKQVPQGKVTTYGALAAAAGKLGGARQVGYAMAHMPKGQKIPAHRVLSSSGALAPEYVFGPGFQRQLLEAEGVTFLPSGKVNLKKHFYQPVLKQSGSGE